MASRPTRNILLSLDTEPSTLTEQMHRKTGRLRRNNKSGPVISYISINIIVFKQRLREFLISLKVFFFFCEMVNPFTRREQNRTSSSRRPLDVIFLIECRPTHISVLQTCSFFRKKNVNERVKCNCDRKYSPVREYHRSTFLLVPAFSTFL